MFREVRYYGVRVKEVEKNIDKRIQPKTNNSNKTRKVLDIDKRIK